MCNGYNGVSLGNHDQWQMEDWPRGTMARAEREPVTRVWAEPSAGPGAAVTVGQAESFLSIFVQKMGQKLHI